MVFKKACRQIALGTAVVAATTACSSPTDKAATEEANSEAVPDAILGQASWDDHRDRPLHRVSCGFDAPFYRFKAEGHEIGRAHV